MATLEFVEGSVEHAGPEGEEFAAAREGAPFRLGDRIRTGPASIVYLTFPWMKLQIGESTNFEVPDSLILSAMLERGRMEPLSTGGGIIKLVTDEAEIRGDGLIVVRRDDDVTLLTVRTGRFTVNAGSRRVDLTEGQGLRIPADGEPVLLELPPAPEALDPGEDPAYIKPTDSVPVTWTSTGSEHYLEVLPLHSEHVVKSFDVAEPPVRLSIPWVGTFRWRVAVREEQGVEGHPSREGLIAVVER